MYVEFNFGNNFIVSDFSTRFDFTKISQISTLWHAMAFFSDKWQLMRSNLMRFGLIEYLRTICSFDVKRGFGTT